MFWTITSCWAIVPASSRSLLLMSPVGLAKVTRRCCTGRGKGARQSNGGPSGCVGSSGGKNKTPPMPGLAASTAPYTTGSPGMSSAIRLGRVARSAARTRKSCRKWWTGPRRRTLCVVSCRRASCMVLNKPRAPGMAVTMERSSPRMRCQALVAMRLRVGGTASRISLRRRTRCGGNCSVMAVVSTSQPRMTFWVLHVASPFVIFLPEAGSCRCAESLGLRGRRTLSKACIRWRLVLALRRFPP